MELGSKPVGSKDDCLSDLALDLAGISGDAVV